MKKTSGNAKTLRTSIADLQAAEVSEADLARVGGGIIRGPVNPGGPGGGIGASGDNHCWEASTSMTNPGEPDKAQDWVVD